MKDSNTVRENRKAIVLLRVSRTRMSAFGIIKMMVAEMTGGGGSHMKGAGMLVVSLRGINFGFWSNLGCYW